MYLDQPFDDYCITRKELLDLLRRHHKTTIELEKEKEEKKRYVLGFEAYSIMPVVYSAASAMLVFVSQTSRLIGCKEIFL